MKVAIFAAMQFELFCLLRKIDSKIKIDCPSISITKGTIRDQEVILIRTGVGKEGAENAAKSILNCYSPDIVFLVGAAGGVRKGLKLGDMVVVSRIYSENQESLSCDSKLQFSVIKLLWKKKIRFHIGNTLTVPRIISCLKMKKEIAESFPVSIVEMESYWIASVLNKIPFLAIRIISDTANEGIPDFTRRLFYLYEWRRIIKVLIGIHRTSKLLLSFLDENDH